MNEDLSYAEMLEIPVETVTVNKREKKRKYRGQELSEQLVEQVNDRMEESDPLFAESKPIAREGKPRSKREKLARRIVLGEFVAACALILAIFLTNILLPESAINTFVRGLFNGNASAQADMRDYDEFTLTPVVSDNAEVTMTVSETGVLSFTADCAVYPPCAGTVTAVNGSAEEGYTLEIKHSDKFSTVMSGLDAVYCSEGETVYGNIAIARSNGEGEVRVSFYSGGEILNCYTVNGTALDWS